MLQLMREKMSGWLTWFFVIVLVLVFALFGLGYYFDHNSNQGQEVAVVNGQAISRQQVQVAFENLRAQMPEQSLTDQQIADLKTSVLKQLISEALLYQSAEHMGMGVSDQDIDLMIYQLPAFQENGQFSPARYQAILQRMGLTTDAVRKQLATTLMTNQFQAGIGESGFAISDEVNQLNRLQQQQRDYRYLVIPHNRFAGLDKVSDTSAKAYYEAHKKLFLSEPRVKVSYIELSVDQLMSRITVSEKELMQYYQAHPRRYLEDFSAEKSQVEQDLKKEKAQVLFGELGDKLANLAFENPDSLTYLSSELDLKLQTSQWMTQKGLTSGLFHNPEVLQAAFSQMVLEEGDNSDVINLTPEHAVVLRVSQYEPAKLKPFSTVEPTIKQKLAKQDSAAKAKSLAEHVALHLNDSALLQENHLKWEFRHHVSLQKQSDPMDLAAFHQFVPEGKQLPEASVVTIPDQTYVVQTTRVVIPSPSDKMGAEQAALLSTRIKQDWTQYEYEQYLLGLHDSADIELSSSTDS